MFFLFTVIACPVIDCGDQDIGVCASIEDGGVVLNERGCTKSTSCELLDLVDWNENSGTFLYCQEFEDQDSHEDSVHCPERDKNEALESDYHPVRCNSTQDCLTKNGNESECKCGMDGFSYCMPLWGSEVFENYWNFCEDGDGKTSYKVWNYYRLMYLYYNFYISAPDCALNIFYELQDLQDAPSFAWRIGVVGFIALV
jgi:hypothetical protein